MVGWDIGQILRKLCDQKHIEIVEANPCPDHIHNVGMYSAKSKHMAIYGIFKREDQPYDFR